MNPKLRQAIVTSRRRSNQAMMDWHDDYNMPMNRSGSMGVRPDGTSYPIYPESKFRDRTGREHYDNGRFAPMSYYDFPPTVPPVYRRGEPMNKIGFNSPPEFTDNYGYKEGMGHKEHEKMRGGIDSMEDGMTWAIAEHWTNKMENADGSVGPHWPIDQTRQIMEQYKIQCDEIEFYATINMMYSDYCKVAKKFNVSTTEFYACMAKAFLEDKDAGPEKLTKYYEYIVK